MRSHCHRLRRRCDAGGSCSSCLGSRGESHTLTLARPASPASGLRPEREKKFLLPTPVRHRPRGYSSLACSLMQMDRSSSKGIEGVRHVQRHERHSSAPERRAVSASRRVGTTVSTWGGKPIGKSVRCHTKQAGGERWRMGAERTGNGKRKERK